MLMLWEINIRLGDFPIPAQCCPESSAMVLTKAVHTITEG
jgi:hypothetical protein